MASNNGGYYDNSHSQAQFRRATGRVAMASNAATGPPLHHQSSQQMQQPQQYAHVSPKAPPPQHLYGPPPPQYIAEQQMQPVYAPGPGSAMNHRDADSAIPAPRIYQQQQQQPMYQVRPVNPGYPPPHAQVQQHAPPSHHGMPAQQQQPVQHYAPPQGQHAQVQYQGVNAATQHQPQHQQVQRVNESAGWDQYDDGSEESLDLYSHHQRSRQQQQGHKPNPSMSADSAIHNGSYAGPPVYGTEPAVSSTAHSSLTDDFRRMGISSGQTMSRQQGPPAARKNVSSEALRKREQQLEDEYDDDDGIAGVDIDVTLFPTNSRQMAHIGRSEKYGSPADSAPHTTSSSPAGAPPSVRNPALAIAGGGASPRANMSRNGSPMGPQHPPQDMAGGQRFYGSAGRSGPPSGMHSSAATTNNSSPVYAGRPYANDNGFDSSSDRIAGGGGRPALQQYPPQPQHQQDPYQQQQMQHQQVYGAPAQFYSDPHSRNGTVRVASSPYAQVPHNGLQPPGPINDTYAHGSNYSLSSSGDVLPQPGMRPWTSSSKSLPMAVGHHSGERDAPSSGSSSAVGIAPMGNMPSAKVIGASPLAKPPPPTLASLEAYRASIRRSNDPAAQLEFAKYIMEHARSMADQESNGKAAAARYEMLTSEGIKLVKKLAGGGITVHRTNIAAEAQFFLGTVYSQNVYVEKDEAKAFAYYQQASKAQHAEANYRTAVCYEIGVGTRKDVARALQFYRKAAAQTNVPAMYKLGVILTKGLLGVAATPREGITWLKRGADNATPECPHALHELALCYESNSIPDIIPDEAYARELFIKAGKLGYVPSQVRLGQAYEYGTLGCAVDPRKSIGWYTRAAEKGDGDAELALSGWYLTGAEHLLPQNDVEAYLWARRAADRGLEKAEYAVGYYYECGIGVAQPDVHEAQAWYARAARKNNRRAISRLRELKQMGVQAAAASRMSRPRRSKEGSLF
ncbi:hypothetical protein H4R27_005016 [Coemansia aciculifera]|nr:hypothetical protein H4R27_005016 [Coemansia aciculifera]